MNLSAKYNAPPWYFTEQSPKCPEWRAASAEAAKEIKGLITAKRVTMLKQELAEAELAARTERGELADKIDAELARIGARHALLADIRVLRVSDSPTHPRKEFVKYRDELAGIADKYGVQIVLVGDKTAATLVLK